MNINLDNAIWLANIVTEAAVVALLTYRRVWRNFPFFFLYCAWDMLDNVANLVIFRSFHDKYLTAYLVETAIDSVLEFGILVELSRSILRPFRSSVHWGTLLAAAFVILAVGAAIWPFSGIQGLANLGSETRILMRVEQTSSILRILFFLLLAGCSQLLSIGWRDRELQIATGLGFYSFFSLAIAMVQTHQIFFSQYRHLNLFVVASYFCSLLYWVVCFAQKEAERKEFTPQMQNFLLALAGTAQTTRVSLLDSTSAKPRKPEQE